tara:strand:- start:2127 stop:3932 length:1806 start_codon:yes stop_codon:yes gene_type:complete
MFNNFQLLFNILDNKQKKRFYRLLSLMILVSFFELTSLVLLIDFVNFIGFESNINQYNGVIEKFLKTFGINFPVNVRLKGIFVISILFISLILTLIETYLSARFIAITSGEIETNLFSYYLKRDYLIHINMTSDKFINNIYELAKRTTEFVLSPSLIILSNLLFLVPLILGLLIFKPFVTLLACALFVLLYFSFYKIFKRRLFRLGKLESESTKEKFGTLQDGFGSIKETKLLNKFNFFVSHYRSQYLTLAKLATERALIAKLPRNFIEFLVFSISILIVVYLIGNLGFGVNEIIFTVGFFIICAYKIIPAFQRVYYHLNIARYHSAALVEIAPDLKLMKEHNLTKKNEKNKSKFFEFKKISLNKINFNYENVKIPTLNDISLNINRGEKIAITGPSGAGKTTLINLITCLIKQTSGEITIDGIKLDKQYFQDWQKLIGFVPQNVYLTKQSIKENIAFGVRSSQIDELKIKELLKFVQLNEVVQNLPNKENTLIGERGIKLSGGQQQRIGIARALYNNPKLLIFDEATNALDVLTENEILNSIDSLDKNFTVLMIAHRLDLVKRFDKIIYINNGRLSGFDTYNNLKDKNKDFKDLVKDQKK